MASDIPPNQTIYVNNLPEKLKKDGRSRAYCSRELLSLLCICVCLWKERVSGGSLYVCCV